MRTQSITPSSRPRINRFGLVLVLASAIVASAVPANAEPHDPNAPRISREEAPLLVRVRQSLDYLMTTYAVTEAEALRRLRLQARAAAIAEAVHRQIGDELLDVRLDQEGGGRLRLLTSEPQRTTQAISVGDMPEVTVVRSKYSAAQLRAAGAEVAARLAGQTDVAVEVDPATESVVVRHAGGETARAATLRTSAGKQAGNGVPVVVDVTTPLPPDQVDQRGCASVLECDAPMRGGARLHIRRDNGSWGSCTSGFNIRASNGWAFILTAGHCVIKPGPKRQFVYHNGLPAVWEHNASGSSADPNSPADGRYIENSYPRWDYAMLPFQTDGHPWHSYWLDSRGSHNLVNSQCVGPSNGSCISGTFAIRGWYDWSQIQVGWVVCATGSATAAIYPNENTGYTPGTRCGQIKNKNMVNYESSGTAGRGLKADICSRPGDSGGPLFSQIDSYAYGILSGGKSRSGACNMSHPDEYGVYAPVSEILSRVGARTGLTMWIISTASG